MKERRERGLVRPCQRPSADPQESARVHREWTRAREWERETCSVDVTTATTAITKSTSEATGKFWEFRRSRSWHPIRFTVALYTSESQVILLSEKKWKNQSICLYVSLEEIIISFLSSNNNTNKMYISRTGKRLRRMSVSLVKKNYLSETSVCDSANSLLCYTSC